MSRNSNAPLTLATKSGALIVALLAMFGTATVSGAELTGRELVAEVEQQLWGTTNAGVAEMTVITPRWRRTLLLKFWMERPERTFIRILEPAKESGIGSLRIKTEMWNYLPSVERVIKIPPSMMLQPWMGSDLSNDDLVKESSAVEDYVHTLLGREQLNSVDIYRVESIPKPEAAVVWGKILYKITADDHLPLVQEYYDERGDLVKILTFSDVRTLGGRKIPTRWEMQPVRKPQNKTVFLMKDIAFDQGLDASIFTLQNLQRSR